MKSSVLVLIVMTVLANLGCAQSATQDHLDYIEKYKDIAIREMERAGIPASIKLAQAILESDAGRSDLARRANNHFGIKCNTEWDGKKYYKKDDDYDDRGKLIESCFRVYQNPDASFVAHSEFLRDPKKLERYGFLFRLDPTDYRRWARGLRSSGYATAGNYDSRLIDLIERYELYKYDQMSAAPGEIIVSEESTVGYRVNNDVKYVLAMDNEPVEEIARRTFTSLSTLLDYNENLTGSDQRLAKDEKVYLQPKRTSYRGKQTWHYVKQGENMMTISNQYAIRLDKLYERNRMPEGTEPAPNERIKLRGGRVSDTPKLLKDMQASNASKPVFLFDDEEEEVAVKPTTEKPQPKPETVAKPSTPPVTVANPNSNNNNKPTNNPIEPETPQNQPQKETTFLPPVTPQPVKVEPETQAETGFDESFFEASKPVPQPVNAAIYHTVAKGDTLWNISQRYGTTVAAVKKLNNLNSDSIQLGMKLQVK